MWNEKNSIALSKLAVYLFTGVLVGGDIAGYWLVRWFLAWPRMQSINDLPHLVWALATLYTASLAAYVLLYQLFRLLANIENEQVFVPQNVRALRIASWCCIAVAAVCLAGALYYIPILLVCAAAAFMALIIRIVKNVFERAIGMKAELDLTI